VVTLTIDGEQVCIDEGSTILEAARKININIPHLCYFKELSPIGSCGLCIVEIEGERSNTRSCTREVAEGMKITTNSPNLRSLRKMLIELLLANHPSDCQTCERNQNCELLDLATELDVKEIRFDRKIKNLPLDETSPSIIRTPDKCILCGRCIRVCSEVQSVNAIDFARRGAELEVSTVMNKGLGNVECVNCGQCIHVCPVAAIKERSSIDDVWAAIFNPNKHVIVQEAPAVRVALGEELGLPVGSLVTGKMHAALRKIGFDAIFDTNFSADLTILEEGNELIRRVQSSGTLPMFTSCCPGWIKFVEHFYSDLIPHISTCKSPQQMFGALAKTYYAKKAGIDPASIVSVSIMPCTAKKYEAQRPEMNSSGYRDVDYVLTTRELSRMIKAAGIDFVNLSEETADPLMGSYTGAATIFGTTGGVMEAALRSAYKLISGKELDNIDILPVRGMQGVKEAVVPVAGLELKVAVVHGLANARKILDELREGKSTYHFIEVMACPGGCVGGGGQPLTFDLKLRDRRAQGLYKEDKGLSLRRSHENPEVLALYQNYLVEPLGKNSHHLLHTHYTPRESFTDLPEFVTANLDAKEK
jgi:NADH-quinone oxidoreductase subunit G